jgi:hypothetical protein
MFRRIVRKNEVRDAIFTDGQSEYGLMWVREDHPLLTTDVLYPSSPQIWELRTGCFGGLMNCWSGRIG